MRVLLPRVYGENEECRQAVLEIRTVTEMSRSAEGIVCRRALYLYALSAEAEVCNYWKRHDDDSRALATDLHERVLPFVVPRFIKQSCQNPHAFLVLVAMLAEMWPDETLGNFPAKLTTIDPFGSCSTEQTAN